MDVTQLKTRIANSAVAFRGYNVTNLGRTKELLVHPLYGPTIQQHLDDASAVCAEIIKRKTDLGRRVRSGREATLRSYAETIAMVVAVELAQLRLLEEFFGIRVAAARISYGFSLGEVSALIASGVLEMQEVLKAPIALARDCVKLSKGVTLAVLFSRGPELSLDAIQRQCLLVNNEGAGVVGVSAQLSPNSVLVMGQGDTLDRLTQQMDELTGERLFLRKNRSQWPPLHTPIVWQKCIPNRAAELMHTMKGGFTVPNPPVFSLVTGGASYNEINVREILHHWVDHPQRLWDAIYETLALGIETVIHVGPQPYIIPATFTRLHDNVEAQTQGSIGMRALSAVVSRPWLKTLLPQRTALLRAPRVKQLILEDWLLENAPTP